jgi:hypothetical protein
MNPHMYENETFFIQEDNYTSVQTNQTVLIALVISVQDRKMRGWCMKGSSQFGRKMLN